MVGIILSVIFGVLGIGATYLFYRKTIKNKKILFNIDSSVLISNSLNKYTNLKITYGDQDITSLSNSIIKIRNTGTASIEPNDLYNERPIIIEISEPLIFNDSEYKIKSSNLDSSVSLEKVDEKTLKVDFEILNPKDVITIEMLHNGDIFMDGKLKNGKIDNSYKKTDRTDKTNDIDRFTNYEEKSYDSPYNFMSLMLKLIMTLLLSFLLLFVIINSLLNPGAEIEKILVYICLLSVPTFLLLDKIK